MRAASRLNAAPMNVFAGLAARLKELHGEGPEIIRLDVGNPDGPPPGFVIDALSRSAADPSHHGYAGFVGTAQLRQAIADYYGARFGVSLDVDREVLPLIGSKEGVAHMALAWLDPGDLALIPDPGYPTYWMAAALAGAEVYRLPLLEANGYLPDLDAIPLSVAARARLLWLNYPNNPTGAVAPLEFFERAVAWCLRHDVLLCHDAPYADVCYTAPSILSIPRAKEVAVEFNSLSKSHNMAGWRVGMAVGNRLALHALLQVKSNVDSGIFLPVQDAAVAALTGDQGWLRARNAEYQYRRDLLHDFLVGQWGLHCARPLAGLYLWPRIPDGYDSVGFAERLLTEARVSVTPGVAFGPGGEGYVRFSVGAATARVAKAVERLRRIAI